MSMKNGFSKVAEEIRKYFANEDLDISKWSPEILRDFYSYNISLSLTAVTMVCIIALIGLIGTYSPYSTGFIIPGISATTVYLIIFGVNAISLSLLEYVRHHMETVTPKRQRQLFIWVTGINMILASATFFTTQKDSSFFFEYILITIIMYLLPNCGMFSFFRNMVINVVSLIIVLSVANHPIAWQDIVDIVILQIVCAFVNQSRLQSFVRREKEKIGIEQQKDQFYHDSRTDELTHIANRTALRIDFPQFLNHSLCIALVDLDFFKKYNDTYGHQYGDRVLKLAGSYLERVFRDVSDHCYRYGGDEFLIISKEETADSFRKRLVDFQKLCASDQNEIDVTSSIGYFSDIPHSENDLRSMIRNADAYLYQAKRGGTGQIDGGVSETVSGKPESAAVLSPASGESVKFGHDPLTGLLDMRTFLDTMRQYRQKKRDPDKEGELAALYFDLVNFRMINLLYGMSYGDETLKKMGKSLQDSFPEGIVSHWDVDHYAVLTDTRNLEKRAEDALNRLSAILPFNTECSVGACVWKDYSLDAETICSRARAASDENRKEVGIHFSYYTEDIGRKLNMDTYVVSHIDEAIEQGWIVVFYQPIVRALSNQICGMEALARWKDPEKGLLPPAAFVGPLEDAKQIYKLDLCVIRQTVKLISDRYQNRLPEIPISINLSRLDFLCCDIYQEIEKLVMDYDIPRRMLHIEVTESIMRSEENEILRALQSFRNAGYELWMDDFGSGYSTLNLLKDYSFDLLKLDMGFLRSDSSRSRDIIVSVIEMDKRLGIRTLAEGVETEEQAEFLKKSGCEKLQGYYFSKPLPFEESLQNCLEKGIGVESAQQKICYDALGHVNFMTDIPLLISEVHNDRTHLLFANDHGLAQFRRDGFSDLNALEDSLNDSQSVASREMLKAVNHAVNANDSGEIAAFFNGKKRLVQFQLLGSYGDTRLFVTHIYGKSREEDPAAVQNQMLVNLTYFYRYLFTINTDDMTIQNMRFVNLTEGENKPEPLKTKDGRNNSLLPAIYEADRKRYDAFLDPSTLLERLKQAEYGIIHGAFRTQAADGTYLWMSHHLLLVPNAGSRQILYAIRRMDSFTEESAEERTLSDQSDLDAAKAEFFDSMMLHIPVPVFWKDRERRFLGVSQSFLDYYGFVSADEVLGKTDEELGWNLNGSEYESVEKDILRTGTIHRNVPGKCIIRGVSHDIHATKWPTYQNGTISGLMGYFLDETALKQWQQEAKDSTEDLSVSRFLDDLLTYKADYDLNHRNFGVLFIEVPELIRIADQFGHGAMNAVAESCSDVIRDTAGLNGSCARLGIGFYAVILSLNNENELSEKAELIRTRINSIHEVNGIPCTLYAKVNALNAKEVMKLNQSVMDLIYPSRKDTAEDQDELVLASGQSLLKLLDEMPIGCYVLKPDHTVVYWSPEAVSILGFTAEEMKGRKCIDMPLGCSFTNGEKVPGQFCPAVVTYHTGRPYSMQMFMRRKDGSDVLVRNILAPLKNHKGKVTELISFFIPLAGKDFDPAMIQSLYETATRDPLTCLPGRKYMEACLQEELEKFRRTGNPFAVLFADADYLHEINNTYGHEAGDAMLKEIGLMLRKNGRRTDRFCRWGGDEFVGLLQLRSPDDVEGIGRRFKASAEKCEIDVHGKKISCQSAIGITVVREGDTAESVIARADQYMYQAKKSNDNHIVSDLNVESPAQ